MKKHGGVDVQIRHSQPSHQREVSGQLQAPYDFTPGKQLLGTHCTGD
jgi:hypothetical protein